MSVFLQPISPVMGAGDAVSNVTLTNTVSPGTYWADTSGNQYVYVQNVHATVQISQGQFGVLATNASGFSCIVCSTTFVDSPIGVARNATIACSAFGWLMYRGFTGISNEAASFVTNQVLIAGLNGNFQALTSAAGSFVTAPILGKALVSIPSQTTCSTAANLNACWVNMM